MNTENQIMSILQAMGATPETITRPNGETVIKINAPEIKKEENAKHGKNEETRRALARVPS